MYTVSKDQLWLFKEQGYLVIKEAVPACLLSEFKATLGKLVDLFFTHYVPESNVIDYDDKIILLKNYDTNIVSKIQKIVSRTPEFFSLSACTNIMPLVRSLYNLHSQSPVYMTNNGVVFTCPNDSNSPAVSNFETDWHNDIFYTIPNSRFWQVWVPLLHPATQEIGTLIVCPGSHKDKTIKQCIDISVNYNKRYSIDPNLLQEYEKKSVEVDLGDLLIFDSHLIHKSGVNSSGLVRCTLLGAYHDALSVEFPPISFEYKYHGKTPGGYFYEIFGDENAKKIMFDDMAGHTTSFKNGV